MRFTILIILVIVLGLTGCAGPNAQWINVQPRVLSVPALPQAPSVNIKVIYPSRQLLIGSMTSRMGDITTVSLTDNITWELTKTAEQTLQRMGVETSLSGNAQLTLTVQNMSLNLRSDGFRQELIGELSILSELTTSAGSFKRAYQREARQEVLTKPSQDKSKEFIDKMTSDVFFRVFNDPGLTRLLISAGA